MKWRGKVRIDLISSPKEEKGLEKAARERDMGRVQKTSGLPSQCHQQSPDICGKIYSKM